MKQVEKKYTKVSSGDFELFTLHDCKTWQELWYYRHKPRSGYVLSLEGHLNSGDRSYLEQCLNDGYKLILYVYEKSNNRKGGMDYGLNDLTVHCGAIAQTLSSYGDVSKLNRNTGEIKDARIFALKKEKRHDSDSRAYTTRIAVGIIPVPPMKESFNDDYVRILQGTLDESISKIVISGKDEQTYHVGNLHCIIKPQSEAQYDRDSGLGQLYNKCIITQEQKTTIDRLLYDLQSDVHLFKASPIYMQAEISETLGDIDVIQKKMTKKGEILHESLKKPVVCMIDDKGMVLDLGSRIGSYNDPYLCISVVYAKKYYGTLEILDPNIAVEELVRAQAIESMIAEYALIELEPSSAMTDSSVENRSPHLMQSAADQLDVDQNNDQTIENKMIGLEPSSMVTTAQYVDNGSGCVIQ